MSDAVVASPPAAADLSDREQFWPQDPRRVLHLRPLRSCLLPSARLAREAILHLAAYGGAISSDKGNEFLAEKGNTRIG